jgi:hypothetical protein
MANPNIVNVTAILANTVVGVMESSNTVFHTNPSASGRVDAVDTIIVSNILNVNTDFTLILTTGGSNTVFMRTIALPSDSAIVVVDKNSKIRLLENSSIGGSASANNAVSYVLSMDQIY